MASHRIRGDAVVLKTWPSNAARHAAPHPTLFKGSPHSLKMCVNLTTVIYLINNLAALVTRALVVNVWSKLPKLNRRLKYNVVLLLNVIEYI